MNRITSASCSIAPDSRRSDITGRLFGRCSSERLSWDSATTGTLSSFASDFIAREISEISVARFSPVVVACISCRESTITRPSAPYVRLIRRVVTVLQRLDPLDDPRLQLSDLLVLLRAALALLGNVQHLRFGLVESLLRAATERVVRGIGDVAGGCGELAQDRAVADDVRIV